MKLVVLGANGRSGQHVVKIALEKRMDVTAVVRRADRSPTLTHPQLHCSVGDPCDPVFLRTVLHAQDALISTLGGRAPTKRATSVYYRSAESIAEAARETGLERVLVTSTALLFPDQSFLGGALRVILPDVVRSAARMEQILQASGLNWTSARVGFLNDAQDANYCAEIDALPKAGTSVSRLALAHFLIDALENPEAKCAVCGVSGADASA